MKAIVIAFTLKGQDITGILATLETIREITGEAVLIHGFLPRLVAVHKKLPLDVVNALEDHYPLQLNLWKGEPLREAMADMAARLGATVYVIGNITDGVAEEVALYKKRNMELVHFELPPVPQSFTK